MTEMLKIKELTWLRKCNRYGVFIISSSFDD